MLTNKQLQQIKEELDNSQNPFYLSATQDAVPVDYNNDSTMMYSPEFH